MTVCEQIRASCLQSSHVFWGAAGATTSHIVTHMWSNKQAPWLLVLPHMIYLKRSESLRAWQCVTRIKQLCIPVGESWDPGLKIMSFPLWERHQSPFSQRQNIDTTCRVTAHQPHITAADRNITFHHGEIITQKNSKNNQRHNTDPESRSHHNTHWYSDTASHCYRGGCISISTAIGLNIYLEKLENEPLIAEHLLLVLDASSKTLIKVELNCFRMVITMETYW